MTTEQKALIKAHNESQNGLNLKTSRSTQGRISETPLFAAPSNQIDLFENSNLIPKNIQHILDTFNHDKDNYSECQRILNEITPLGYSFEYGLDGEPYNLIKLR